MTTANRKKTQLLQDHERAGQALKALYNSAADEGVPSNILKLVQVLEQKYENAQAGASGKTDA